MQRSFNVDSIILCINVCFSGLSPKKNDEQKPFFKECSEATFADTDSMVINVSTVISATYSCLTFLKACLYSVNWTATGAQ